MHMRNNMTKKFFILFVLIFSTMAFAEILVQKEKSFENWTVALYEQPEMLRIVNSKGTASVPKDWVYKDESADSKPKTTKLNEKKERVVVDCAQITVIHGKMEDLETIYNSLNSASDCENMNLYKMGFSAGVAKAFNKNPQTGKMALITDLVLHKGDLEWDE